MAALVACLLVLLIEPPWTVKIRPMLREPPPVDPPALEPPSDAVSAPDVLLSGVDSPLKVVPSAGLTGPGP